MEWVEASGRSLPEAKEIVLDLLGVAEDDAEFVVLSEPRAGLFGRMRGRGAGPGTGEAGGPTAETNAATQVGSSARAERTLT